MTVQEAAHSLLKEIGKPLPSKRLAHLALERGLASSSARTPVESLAQTLEKNVRDKVYNTPELEFVHTPSGRLLGLPEWKAHPSGTAAVAADGTEILDLRARVPRELLDQVQLATQARIAAGFDDTVALLLRRGLSSEASRIKEGLLGQLKALTV